MFFKQSRYLDQAISRVGEIYEDRGNPNKRYRVIGISFHKNPGIFQKDEIYLECIFLRDSDGGIRKLRFLSHFHDRRLEESEVLRENALARNFYINPRLGCAVTN